MLSRYIYRLQTTHAKNLIQSFRAGIFTKTSDLEKKPYDQNLAEEYEQLIYYRNHIRADDLKEDELIEIQKKMEVLEKKFAYLENGGSTAYHDSQHMTLSPQKLREAFATMTEIDANPDSDLAKKYREKVELYEKEHSPKVKPAPTIHRTAKLGMMKTMKVLDDQ